METIRILTDSTSDIPAELADRHQIAIVPALLIMDGREYRDRIDLPRQEFYARLPEIKQPPTTATPPPEAFAREYERLLTAGASHIISIHLATSLSGLCNAARAAARHFEGRVTVIDSGQLSLGLGFQALAAAEAARAGRDAVLAAIAATRERVRVAALLDTLTYLRRSGRVSWARAMLGAAFSLKPLVTVRTGGLVERLGYVRTARQGEIKLLSLLRQAGSLRRLAILHTNAPERARHLLSELSPKLPEPPLIVNVTTVIGAHVGPNGLGFACLTAE